MCLEGLDHRFKSEKANIEHFWTHKNEHALMYLHQDLGSDGNTDDNDG